MRTMLLAFAASHALAGKGLLLAQRYRLPVLLAALVLSLGVHVVVAAEQRGDIHTLRTGHTVPAACAAHLHATVYGFDNLRKQGKVVLGKLFGLNLACHTAVLLNHLHRVHAREHTSYLRLVPNPPKGPLGSTPAARRRCYQMLSLVRHKVNQLAAAQWLHDDHRDAPCGSGFKAHAPCLRMLVEVVVLNLAEVPVVGLKHLEEGIAVAMEREANLPNLACLLLGRNPFLNAQALQVGPLRRVGDHVHEVVVNVVGTQTAQLLVKVAVKGGSAAHHVLRHLCGNVHFVP